MTDLFRLDAAELKLFVRAGRVLEGCCVMVVDVQLPGDGDLGLGQCHLLIPFHGLSLGLFSFCFGFYS